MSHLFNKNSSNFSRKLKESLTNLSVDIFGHEKKVSSNIINHTHKIAVQEKVMQEQLYIRLFLKNNRLRTFLYKDNKPIRVIAIDELVDFFLDQGASSLLNDQSKIAITISIKKYLKEFSVANKIHEENTQIWINVKDDLVTIRAFNNSKFIKEISLSSLIKYFK